MDQKTRLVVSNKTLHWPKAPQIGPARQKILKRQGSTNKKEYPDSDEDSDDAICHAKEIRTKSDFNKDRLELH